MDEVDRLTSSAILLSLVRQTFERRELVRTRPSVAYLRAVSLMRNKIKYTYITYINVVSV